MTRLVIDARWLTTGIGTYTWNLLTRIKSKEDLYVRAVTKTEHKDRCAPFCDDVRVVDAKMYSVAEQWAMPGVSRGFDIMHATHYNAPLLTSARLVVSIHDLNHVLDATFRRTWKSRLYAQPMFSLAAKRAAHILTISEYSKRKIVEHLGVPEGKVTVTFCGVAPEFFTTPRGSVVERLRKEFIGTQPFLLYVGNLRPHKNVPGLLRAFALAHKGPAKECRLLIIGNDPSNGRLLRELAAELGLGEEVKFVPKVSDEELRAAYQAAEMTVLPSFEEGFGLPVIESMASGTPVICSAAASMPEVGGRAAQYFDPYDIESMAAAIERVIEDSELRLSMKCLGVEQARRFTWEACADKVLSVYRHVAN